MIAYLGVQRAYNDHPQHDDGTLKAVEDRDVIDADTYTHVDAPAHKSVLQVAHEITAPGGIWAAHSPDDAPTWVASDNAALAALLADHYGCDVRPFTTEEATK